MNNSRIKKITFYSNKCHNTFSKKWKLKRERKKFPCQIKWNLTSTYPFTSPLCVSSHPWFTHCPRDYCIVFTILIEVLYVCIERKDETPFSLASSLDKQWNGVPLAKEINSSCASSTTNSMLFAGKPLYRQSASA